MMKYNWIRVTMICLCGLLLFFGGGDTAMSAEEPLGGQSELTGDIFGKEGGWIHATLGASMAYTDNVYYADSDEESDTFFVISPMMWLAMPGTKEAPIEIVSQSTSLGGMRVSSPALERNRQYQTYLMYKPVFELYSEFDDENQTSQDVSGYFQYNFGERFSIDVLDRFLDSYESRVQGVDGRTSEYTSNRFHIATRYEIASKTRLRLDYNNFIISYEDDEDIYRDRTDNGGAAYLYYDLLAKTSLFINYTYNKTNYDDDTRSDSDTHGFYGGVQWEVTEKTSGEIKAGYQLKTFDESEIEDDSTFSFGAGLNYIVTPKTEIDFSANRSFSETDYERSNYVTSTDFSADLLIRFTDKLSSSLTLGWSRDEYDGQVIDADGVAKSIDDDVFEISPSLTLEPRDWLKLIAGYSFERRNSSILYNDFDCNTFYVTVSAGF